MGSYTYSGLDSAASRPTSLSGSEANTTSAITLEAFKYLGAAAASAEGAFERSFAWRTGVTVG